MKIKDEIQINRYGQSLIGFETLADHFETLDYTDKRAYLVDLSFLIMQSKAENSDIDDAIHLSRLRPTFTPCVIIRKGGVNMSTLNKIINLPKSEYHKIFTLLISLFKIGYARRFVNERGDPNKWWYWDLSDEMTIKKILTS